MEAGTTGHPALLRGGVQGLFPSHFRTYSLKAPRGVRRVGQGQASVCPGEWLIPWAAYSVKILQQQSESFEGNVGPLAEPENRPILSPKPGGPRGQEPAFVLNTPCDSNLPIKRDMKGQVI